MPSLPNPVIVVPGITGSELRDEYAVSPETVWSAVLNKDYERLALHPDDLRYELLEPARIANDAVFRIAYGNLIEELRYNLTERSDEPVPVYPFPYDWRQPLDLVEARLGAFVQEVIARTKLMRHYDRSGYSKNPAVNLVGHSMGGLIIAGYLEHAKKASIVEKVATLGTPFRGSLEAPIKVITGTASMGGEVESASREREAARLTPALYHLVPRFAGALQVDPGLPDDLYSVDAWQQGVIDTLAEFIRLHGLRDGSPTERKKWAQELLGEMLDKAKVHRDRVESLTLHRAGLKPDAWLCLVGVDTVTRCRLQIRRLRGKPVFDLSSEDRRNDWHDSNPANRTFTGDGTVPFLGSEPSFLQRKNLVCLRPDDFGYWEVRDRLLNSVGGFHAMLPNLNLSQRLIVSHFQGRRAKGTWGRPAPGIDKDWDPPIKGLEHKE